MNDKIPLMNELTGFIEDARGALLNAEFFAKGLVPDMAKAAIERNHTLLTIAHNEDLETRIPLFHAAVAGFVGEDFERQSMADHVVTLLRQVTASLASAQSMVLCFGEAETKTVRALQGQVSSLTAQLQTLTARAREHAINEDAVRAEVWAITDGKCYYCEVDLVRGSECQTADRSNVFHVDHLVPKSCGGPDHLSNYVPACQSCNLLKAGRRFADFMAAMKKVQPPKLALVASSGNQN